MQDEIEETTSDDVGPNARKKAKAREKCFNCSEQEHFARQCPVPQREGAQYNPGFILYTGKVRVKGQTTLLEKEVYSSLDKFA